MKIIMESHQFIIDRKVLINTFLKHFDKIYKEENLV